MVYGVFGYIKLKKMAYLILIEEASFVGQILKGNVFRVEKLRFVPVSLSDNLKPNSEDLEYIDMIQKIQEEKSFYFSYDIDLTKNIQSTVQECQNSNGGGGNQYNLPPQNYLTMKEAYPNSVDYIGHYAFNDRLLGEFQGIEYSPFKVPCIFGYVFVS